MVTAMPTSRYQRPDTSDKTEDESWVMYWDRKRIERHGDSCRCNLCLHSERLRELGKTLLPLELQEWIEDL